MSMQTIMALPPQAQRRNRLLLAALMTAIAPIAGIAAGVLISTQSKPGPLLLAVEEMPLDQTEILPLPELPARATVRHADSNLVSELNRASETEAAVSPILASPRSLELSPTLANEVEFHDGMRWFNGRPVRPVRTMKMLVTAYSPDERSCGPSADGTTASGYSVWTNAMKMAAADTTLLPFGTLISVPGYDGNAVVPVLDRGGAIKGHRLDMLYPTHEQARAWGAQHLEITVWEYADGRPNDFHAIYNSASAVKN